MLYTPLLDGLAIFGSAVRMQPCVLNPPAIQQTSYVGLDGVEEMPLGRRGAYTIAHGILSGLDLVEFNAVLMTWRSLYINRLSQLHVLRDPFGVLWPNVRLDSFAFAEDRIRRALLTGGLFVDYEARFFHLSTIPLG